MPETLTPIPAAVCEHTDEIYSPHSGCAEFGGLPDDVIECDGEAAVAITYFDAWLDAQAPGNGRDVMVLCAKHAPIYRADLAADADVTVLDITNL